MYSSSFKKQFEKKIWREENSSLDEEAHAVFETFNLEDVFVEVQKDVKPKKNIIAEQLKCF